MLIDIDLPLESGLRRLILLDDDRLSSKFSLHFATSTSVNNIPREEKHSFIMGRVSAGNVSIFFIMVLNDGSFRLFAVGFWNIENLCCDIVFTCVPCYLLVGKHVSVATVASDCGCDIIIYTNTSKRRIVVYVYARLHFL